MKITKLKTYICNCFRTNWVFVKVETDSGIHGWGEATLEYREPTVAAAIHDLEGWLIGRDPHNIEAFRHDCYRDAYWRGGPVLMSALAGVEIALWDIKGKALGVPVWQLLGGKVRDAVPIYVNGWFAPAKTPDEFAAKAAAVREHRFLGCKWDPFGKAYMYMENADFRRSLEIVEAVRGAVGNDVDLLIEGHGRFDIATGIKIANALKPFDPYFFEEPTPPDCLDALAQVHKSSPVPIAAGERLYSLTQMRDFLERGCADFVQPDISHCGGISAVKKMAALCEAHYVALAPHNPSGPVANAATLHIAASTQGFRIMERSFTDVSWRKELTNERVVFDKGNILIPTGVGLGLEINEENCLKYPFQPIDLRHYKGTLTNIRPADHTSTYFEGL